jgi:hypothetical protein
MGRSGADIRPPLPLKERMPLALPLACVFRGDLSTLPPGPLPLLPGDSRQPRGRPGRAPEHDGEGDAGAARGEAAHRAEAVAVPSRPQRVDRTAATAPPKRGVGPRAGGARPRRGRDRGPARAASAPARRPGGAARAPARRAVDARAGRAGLRADRRRAGDLAGRRTPGGVRGATQPAPDGGGT